ncbi:hypothetical protein LOTGIDRAFT_154252 [Lottia gigantea]|uniref:G-protein coupled receptors family 1 profile domain-containing protein n=1 Tax=Lottia gigantea TaxID=225164 RepID=V4A2J7_LOTGI|nr:hypothetical protein LOTGIDRAFT_154252 [Lottia gigantea]ESO89165.1 hypothetical protein LOTGIDRAFT_154252 [Lottia gigantea]
MIELKNCTMTNSSNIGKDNNGTEELITTFVAPLLETKPILSIIYISILSVAFLIGTVGNTLTIIISSISKNVNKVGREFLINLALADLCVSGFADPMCIVGVVKGQRWFSSRVWFCELISSLCLTACFCAFLNLTLVSFNRYIYVCKNRLYYVLFKTKVCIVLCLVTWVAAFLFQFPNFIGWGDHTFDEKNHQCIWDRTKSYSYTLFVSIALIGSPLLFMTVAYILIFWRIFQTKVNVYSYSIDDPDRLKKAWKETAKSSRTLFILFVVFVVCWTPYTTVISLDVADDLPMEVHIMVTLVAHLHSSSTFVVYMISNRPYRRAAFRLLCRPTKGYRTGMLTGSTSTATTTTSDASTKSQDKKVVHTICK